MVAAAQMHLKYDAHALAKGKEEMHAQDKQTVDKALNESDRGEILGLVITIDSIQLSRNDNKSISELHHKLALNHRSQMLLDLCRDGEGNNCGERFIGTIP